MEVVEYGKVESELREKVKIVIVSALSRAGKYERAGEVLREVD